MKGLFDGQGLVFLIELSLDEVERERLIEFKFLHRLLFVSRESLIGIDMCQR